MSIINPSGKEIFSVTTELCGKPLTLEVNRVGFRTTASVLVTYGDTVVLGSASVGTRPVVLDYFPLSIDYEEKFYAAGKISGSRFIKREGRPSDDAILIGRLIDRPIRPLFPKGYRQEVQVVSTVLSMDPNFRPDMIAMIAASSALMLTGTPFDGPVAGLRVGRVNGKFKAFLSPEERDASDLDLVVAGTEGGITMVEAGAEEVPEDVIIDAMAWAFEALQPAIKLQQELKTKVAPKEQQYTLVLPNADIQAEADKWVDGKLGEAIRKAYPERNELVNEIRLAYHVAMAEAHGGEEEYKPLRDEYDEAFTMAVHKDVRKGIVDDNTRPDGRKLDEIRPLSSEVGVLPRAHGSSLFTLMRAPTGSSSGL
jgi:polyribonucleotide nucleotidyltransferase